MLTTRGTKKTSSKGLRAGAHDYLVKPFHAKELYARILVGLRAVTSQGTLADRVHALEVSALNVGSSKLRIHFM